MHLPELIHASREGTLSRRPAGYCSQFVQWSMLQDSGTNMHGNIAPHVEWRDMAIVSLSLHAHVKGVCSDDLVTKAERSLVYLLAKDKDAG